MQEQEGFACGSRYEGKRDVNVIRSRRKSSLCIKKRPFRSRKKTSICYQHSRVLDWSTESLLIIRYTAPTLMVNFAGGIPVGGG